MRIWQNIWRLYAKGMFEKTNKIKVETMTKALKDLILFFMYSGGQTFAKNVFT